MKRLIILVLVVCLCAGMIVPIHAVEGMTVSAEEVTVEPGEKFAVNIAVDNNSGFAYLKIRLTYDSNLFEFHNKESKSLSSALILTAGPALVSWDSSSDFTADQEIGTLWFTASESIAAGTYTIGVSVVECYDINTDDVQTIAQAITVKVGASAPAVDSVKPVINHTKVTNAKSGEAVSLAANVTDNVGVTSVKLYWRATNGAWNTVAMSNTTGSEYVATIAGTNVTTAGIEYYIEASDGVNTASEGSAAAPIAIAVEPEVDSVLPVLTHNRITSANEGKAISFTTTATDNVGIAYVKLYWRVTNGAWSAIDMTCVEGNIYAATIAGTNVTTDGIEYYIEASDATNTVSEGSAAAPIKVNVESSTTPDNVKPTLSHDRVTKGSNGQPINISATASDNKGLEYVKLYWRVTNGTWNVIDMTNTYGDNYVATIAGENVTTAGIEYYIEISDGTSIVCEASASYPVSITIEYKLGIYSVTPNTIDASAVSNNVVATLVGYNFSETMKLTVGGEAIDYIFVNSSTITFVIPRGNLISADIKLVDGSRVATLNNAITYTDKNSKIEIVAPGVAKPGEVIKLPIIITATGEIFSIEMKLQLTNSLYSSIKFEKASGMLSALLTYATDDNGVVSIAISSADALPNGAVVGYLCLTPNAVAQSTSTNVSVISAEVNAKPVGKMIDTNLTIVPNFTISGKITYYGTDEGIAGVTVSLDNGMTTVTDENGVYTFVGVTSTNVVVTPYYEGNVNNAITSQDASLILQVSTSSVELNDYQKIAADVDGDGRVTALDAAYILQKSVGKIEAEFPGTGAEWAFVEESIDLSLSANATDVNFTAILLGDVSGNWTAKPVEEFD